MLEEVLTKPNTLETVNVCMCELWQPKSKTLIKFMIRFETHFKSSHFKQKAIKKIVSNIPIFGSLRDFELHILYIIKK